MQRRPFLAVLNLHGKTGALLGYRILDFRSPYSSRELTDQLKWTSLAKFPQLESHPYEITVELDVVHNDKPDVVLLAWSTGNSPNLLSELRVPSCNFGWIGHSIARELKLIDEYVVCVAALDADHTLVREWQLEQDRDVDFAIEDGGDMVLPSAASFTTEKLGGTRVIHHHGSWMKCIFTEAAYRTFVEAAMDANTRTEVGFYGTVCLHLADGQCCTLINSLAPVEGEASQLQIRTTADQFYRAYHELDGPLGAYLHTHPKIVDGIVLGPIPSGPDLKLALQLNASVATPVVLPIAMAPFANEEEDLAAHSFELGLLSPTDLEVLL